MTINRYIMWRVLRTYFSMLLGFVGIIWIIQFVNFVDEFLEFGAGTDDLLRLALYLVPRALGYVAIPALMLSSIVQFTRLIQHREYYVLAAMGVSPWTILRPGLLLGLFVSVLHIVISTYVAPDAMQNIRSRYNALERNHVAGIITPGTFRELTRNVLAYADATNADGSLARVIVHDARDDTKPITYIAESGTLVQTSEATVFVFSDGYIQPRQSVDTSPHWVRFRTYSLSVSNVASGVLNLNELSARDLTLPQVLRPAAYGITAPEAHKRIIAYRYEQLTYIVTPFVFVLLSFAIITAGGIRRGGYGRRITIASILTIIYYASVITLALTYSKIALVVPAITTIAAIITILIRHEPQFFKKATSQKI